MLQRVAVIGSLLIGLASFSFAQADASRQDPFNHGMRTHDNVDSEMAIVVGVVRSQDNRGVANARVEVRDVTGTTVASTYTGPNGGFQINGLRTGRYDVVATVGLCEAREHLALEHGENNIALMVNERTPSADAGNATSVSVADMRVPDKARKALNKAHELIGKHRNDDAQKELAKALEIYPQYSDAYRERGIMQFAAGNVDAAINDLQQAIKYDPNNAMAYMAIGAALNNQEKYDDALRALDRGVTLSPNAWQAYFEMARAQLGKGDFAASLRSCDRAQQFMTADYAPFHLVRAHALMGVKNYAEAQAELEAFISGNPSSEDVARVQKTLNEVKAFTARASSGK